MNPAVQALIGVLVLVLSVGQFSLFAGMPEELSSLAVAHVISFVGLLLVAAAAVLVIGAVIRGGSA